MTRLFLELKDLTLQKKVSVGEEFTLSADEFGRGDDVGDIKLKLMEVLLNSAIINILADDGLDGQFYPRDPVERMYLGQGSCIDAFPLVMDVVYNYCFNLDIGQPTLRFEYKIVEESTLPTP